MRSVVQDDGVGGVRGRRPAACVCCTVILLVLTTVALGAAPASAHTELVSSSPDDGASVARLPLTVELAFSEAVRAQGAFVVVADLAGTQVEVGDPEVVDGIVTQSTTGDGPAGDYTIAYRVVSADGHPVTGEVGFEVETAGEPARRTAPQAAAQPADAAAGGPESDEGFVSRHAGFLGLAAAALVAAAILVGVGVRGHRAQD